MPILYSTDLFHPHEDPDDHYDLACLFAMPEFDIKGVILDLGERQAKTSGRPAVEQMMQITGRRVPVAVGLSQRLRTRDDKALDEPEQFQGAVKLILSTLRESPEKVTLFTTGSCRDVAAAFNREPALMKEKVRAVYFNIGRGPNERQDEWNVGYDPESYLRLFESGLPIYWCPCFGKDGYETLYVADQTAVVGGCAPAVQNYFVYCLTKSKEDPIAFLKSGPHPLPKGPRNMWCTAPMLHAAGRKVYQRGPGDFVALAPAAAEKAGLAGKAVEAFHFVPMRAWLDAAPDLPAGQLPAGKLAVPQASARLRVEVGGPQANGFVFRSSHKEFKTILPLCLKSLLVDLGRQAGVCDAAGPSWLCRHRLEACATRRLLLTQRPVASAPCRCYNTRQFFHTSTGATP